MPGTDGTDGMPGTHFQGLVVPGHSRAGTQLYSGQRKG